MCYRISFRYQKSKSAFPHSFAKSCFNFSKSNGASCYQDPQIPCAQCYIKHSCWSLHASVHTTNHVYFWIPQLTSGRSISYAQPLLKSMEIPTAAGRGVFGWARAGYFRNRPPHKHLLTIPISSMFQSYQPRGLADIQRMAPSLHLMPREEVRA